MRIIRSYSDLKIKCHIFFHDSIIVCMGLVLLSPATSLDPPSANTALPSSVTCHVALSRLFASSVKCTIYKAGIKIAHISKGEVVKGFMC